MRPPTSKTRRCSSTTISAAPTTQALPTPNATTAACDVRARGALAGAGLQEIELALLHGELDVLHVLVVALQATRDLEDLVVDRRHPLVQGLDRQRRADARDDVLALSVREELGVEARLAR